MDRLWVETIERNPIAEGLDSFRTSFMAIRQAASNSETKRQWSLEWWVGFVRATAGNYEMSMNVDADLLYILSLGGYSNLARIVLATEQLRTKADLNAQVQVGEYGTALCAAAAAARGIETVQVLLAAGADVHLQAQVGDYGTALCAAQKHKHRDIEQLLLETGVRARSPRPGFLPVARVQPGRIRR